MYANDSHAPGSVDRVLLEEMVFLCPETEAYLYTQFTPLDLRYRPGSRPVLEACLKQAVAGCGSPEEQVRAIVAHTSGLGASVTDDLDALQLGGTEEEILQRSTDWCTDLARVGCLLFQLAGLPARILVLADTEQAYSGHVITEVYRSGVGGGGYHHQHRLSGRAGPPAQCGRDHAQWRREPVSRRRRGQLLCLGSGQVHVRRQRH